MRLTAAGSTLVELLVAAAGMCVIILGVAAMLNQSGKINQREHLRAEVQANARNCMARVIKTLRNAGWDPGDHGIATVALDPDPGDSISQIEAFIDANGDGLTAGTAGEQVLIRHVGDRVEWSTDGLGDFKTLAWNITNDADGDGTVEPMFVPDDVSDPHRIRVQVTAEGSAPDPETRGAVRYTVTSEVVLRKKL